MNSIDKRHQQTAAFSWSGSPPGTWRVGNTSVSTEELQAWQLGPARIEYCFAADWAPRSRGADR
jgi:hypothetical protein